MPSDSAVGQPHFLDISRSKSKSDIKAADRVLPEASINLKNEEFLTLNVASNKIIFPSLVKVNSDLPTLKTKEHTYKYDIANIRYRRNNLSGIQRKEIIQNVFVPNSSFHYPKVDGRQFKREWLKQSPWLCYSKSMDIGFCLACVLFDHEFAKGSKAKLLRTDPVRSSPSAVSDFKRHVEGKRKKKDHDKNRTLHNDTSPLPFTVQEKMEKNLEDVDEMLDWQFKFDVSENRKILRSIIDTIIFLGRQDLALMRHRDDSQYHPVVGESTGSIINFIELLNYRVRGGDKDLEKHLESYSKNASYISKTIQNELIECYGQIITENLLQDIKKSQYYSVIADEASDTSYKEQMSLVLRFVDKNFDVREEFLGFLHCKSGLSGKALSETLLGAISELKLDIDDCRGQGYDGAAAASGSKNGMAAHIIKENPKAIYTHCFSHRLDLSICKTCKNTKCYKYKGANKKIITFSQFFRAQTTFVLECIE